jgi:hypothetical protein
MQPPGHHAVTRLCKPASATSSTQHHRPLCATRSLSAALHNENCTSCTRRYKLFTRYKRASSTSAISITQRYTLYKCELYKPYICPLGLLLGSPRGVPRGSPVQRNRATKLYKLSKRYSGTMLQAHKCELLNLHKRERCSSTQLQSAVVQQASQSATGLTNTASSASSTSATSQSLTSPTGRISAASSTQRSAHRLNERHKRYRLSKRELYKLYECVLYRL